MILKLYSKNTSERDLDKIAKVLLDGGVVIYPTDGVYAFGCSVDSAKGVDKLKQLCGKETSDLSLVFDGISSISDYCRIDNATFKTLKRNLPGAVTFILKASSRIPSRVIAKRKTIGARIPGNPITQAIVAALPSPLLTASLKSESEDKEYLTDPELIHDIWAERVDIVIDGGIGSLSPSTVVDISDGEIVVLREGEVEIE
ncbi:MAG: L-threonylcarbamoyladenylate synthase [Rikenellaceae bacterium]